MKTAFIILSVLGLIYWVTANIINRNVRTKIPNPLAAPIIAAVVIFSLMFITMVPAQTCGVVITPAGVMQKSYPTGWHIILPWYRIERMDKTVQVYTCARVATEGQIGSAQTTTIWAPTVDGIKMGFDISASWSIDPEMAWWIYDNVSEQDGGNSGRFFWLEENVIKAKLKSALALTVSKYNPIEVYSNQRQNIQDEVFEKMKNDIAQYHLRLNQIDIREVYYNEAYENAINAKKLEEQRVLTLIEITKQKREQEIQAAIDKNIAIQQAEGEAEALRIKGQSIASNPRIVDLEWIAKWNGTLPTYMLGGNQSIMLGLSK